MRSITLLAAAILVTSCTHGADRETSTAATTSADVRSDALAVLARACMDLAPDPRAVTETARACTAADPGGCRQLGVAHLCGTTGEEDEATALTYFERACSMRDTEACRLKAALAATRHGDSPLRLLD